MFTKSDVKTPKTKRNATKAESVLMIAVMLLVLGVGSGVLGYNIRVCLVVCIFFNMFVAARCGHTWSECMQSVAQKTGPLANLFFILLGIGFVIGTWMMSGTVPVLVAWMAELINPKYILVLTFIFCSILASAIGSNFTTGGTLGLVMFNVAMVQGLPAPVAAGAAVCGATFGTYISPIADQPNNAAIINGYSVNDAMKQMAPPVGCATIISCVYFFVMGLKYSNNVVDSSAQIGELTEAVYACFTPSVLVLLPVLVVVIMSLLRLPSPIVLFTSGLSAAVVGMLVQGFSFDTFMTVAYKGFNSTMLGENVSPMVASLVTRGGMSSLLDGIIFTFLAVMCTSIISHLGTFKMLGGSFNKFKTVGTLNVAASFYTMLTALVTADMAPTHVICAETLQEPFARLGVSPKKVMSLSLSSGRMVTSMLPWVFNAVYMANLYEMTVYDYIPYVVFFPLVVVCQIVLTFMGVGNEKLSAEEAEKFGIAIDD